MTLNPSNTSMVNAEDVAKVVRVGMTFREISRVVSISTNQRVFGTEHGGIWYSGTTRDGHSVELRFSHFSNRQDVSESVLNHAPRVR